MKYKNELKTGSSTSVVVVVFLLIYRNVIACFKVK